jgi:hypothetical protein
MLGFELGELFTNQIMRNTVILLNYILNYEFIINRRNPNYQELLLHCAFIAP